MESWTDLPLILTVPELANLLRVHEATITAMLRSNRIPGQKIGREWRVSRDLLRAWIEDTDHDQALRVAAWAAKKDPSELTDEERQQAILAHALHTNRSTP